jgi:hypothetical protein
MSETPPFSMASKNLLFSCLIAVAQSFLGPLGVVVSISTTTNTYPYTHGFQHQHIRQIAADANGLHAPTRMRLSFAWELKVQSPMSRVAYRVW